MKPEDTQERRAACTPHGKGFMDELIVIRLRGEVGEAVARSAPQFIYLLKSGTREPRTCINRHIGFRESEEIGPGGVLKRQALKVICLRPSATREGCRGFGVVTDRAPGTTAVTKGPTKSVAA